MTAARTKRPPLLPNHAALIEQAYRAFSDHQFRISTWRNVPFTEPEVELPALGADAASGAAAGPDRTVLHERASSGEFLLKRVAAHPVHVGRRLLRGLRSCGY